MKKTLITIAVAGAAAIIANQWLGLSAEDVFKFIVGMFDAPPV